MGKFLTTYSNLRHDSAGNEIETELTVKFTITPGYAASHEEPGCGPDIEITDVFIKGTSTSIELTPAEQDLLCDWIASEDWDDFDPDHARDARRDDLLVHGDFA